MLTTVNAHERCMGRFQIVARRTDGSEIIIWNEPTHDAAIEQLVLFHAHLDGYTALRIDELKPEKEGAKKC